MAIHEVPLLVGGAWRTSSETTEIHDPHSGAVTALAHRPSVGDVDDAVEAAGRASALVAQLPTHRRASILRSAADALEAQGESFARSIVMSCGKCIRDARGEVARAIEVLRVSADVIASVTGEVLTMDALPAGEGNRIGLTMRFPVGVVAAIGPFNAPIQVMCHKIGPAIAAGNAVICKPATQGAAPTADLVRLLIDAGLPSEAIQFLPTGGDSIGDHLVAHPGVDLVAFTGSGAVGERILRTAGLKRTLLELSGNAGVIIHEDAAWEKAVEACVPAAFGIAGQSCVSLQRLYVHESLIDKVSERFAELTAALRTGDTLDEETDVGVMISEGAAVRVVEWIREAERDGATVLTGGDRVGTSVRPTVLASASPQMKVVCEEVFGPVVSILPYSTLDEAIAAVNDSRWGLASGIFTQSLDVALRAARGVRTGVVNINGPSRYRVEHMPYGGLKHSGWGKEGPAYAIEEMSETRMITLSAAL